jgi:protein-arginine kinase activator protein McsA
MSASSEIQEQLREELLAVVAVAKSLAPALDQEGQKVIVVGCKDIVSTYKLFADALSQGKIQNFYVKKIKLTIIQKMLRAQNLRHYGKTLRESYFNLQNQLRKLQWNRKE